MNELAISQTLTVNVRELLHQPGAHKHVVQRGPVPDLATPAARVDPASLVTVDAEIESVVEGLLVTGQVSARATLECARCLRQIEQDLRVDVRELFVLDPRAERQSSAPGARHERPRSPQGSPQAGEARHRPATGALTEDEGYAVLPDDRLPLETMARDAIVLAFPAAPLCRADCAGLCPECGADRNATDCGHRPSADARWSALAGLELGAPGQDEQDGDPD
ncbi:MAG TPA: YceD family protein [Actinomycetota bacterium]